MLEWLALAFFSDAGQEFLSYRAVADVPGIEILEPAAVPIKSAEKLEPKFLGDPFLAVYAQDLASGKVLFTHDENRAQPIASLTKMMTYLVIKAEHDLDEVVTIPYEATQVEGAKAGLYAYEKVSVATMLEAILIPSGNDAALALAIHNAGSEAEFAVKMNQMARKIGLKSAQFHNASGLDILEVVCEDETCDEVLEEKVFGNTMSAFDVALLARTALQDEFFRTTVAKPEFYGQSVDEAFVHEKASTNQLLGSFVGSKGVKTGYTGLAGQCFVNLSEDEAGREILTVVLGSSDRFGETKNLLTWITDSFVWR